MPQAQRRVASLDDRVVQLDLGVLVAADRVEAGLDVEECGILAGRRISSCISIAVRGSSCA
jgi:hypothetical protein